MNTQPRSHLFLFGTVHIQHDGQATDQFRSQRAVALLIYLAAQPAPVPREELTELIWPDFPVDRGRANLRWALSYWKKLLPDSLQATRKTVVFDRAICQVDIHHLATALAEADPALVETAVPDIAADFCRGFFLNESPEFETWLLTQREYWRRQLRAAWQLLVTHFQGRGEYGRALKFARLILAQDTWQEEAQRQVMLLLARSGDLTGALAQYDRCRELLQRELGVPPQPETVRLAARLQTLTERPRHNLPPQPTPFVGRSAELSAVCQLLTGSDTRLVTILAPGGMGKTRLALEAARVVPGAFLDGVAFVPLAPLPDADDLALTILEHLHADQLIALPPGHKEAAEALCDVLADKELLLLLDNYEQLLPETGLLQKILTRAPQVKLLITSQERLRLRWEVAFSLAGLPVPATGAAEWAPGSAAQLFMQSAQRARPGYEPTAVDQAAIREICRLVGGMPLALELAASWVRLQSPPQIAAEIRRSIDILHSPYHDLPPRQRSMQTVFAQTWDRLTTAEQAALSRLAVFRGPFTAAAAVAVVETGWPVLAALVDKSLLRAHPFSEAPSNVSDPHYEMHELLRQFAMEQLAAAGESELVRGRHGRYYAALLVELEPLLRAGETEAQTLERMGREMENIRTAWEWALASGDAAALNEMMDGMHQYYFRKTAFRDGEAIFARAAARFAGGAEELERARRLAYGRLLARQGDFTKLLHEDYREAERLLQRSKEVLEGVAADEELAPVLHTLGNILFVEDLPAAQGYWRRSLTLYRAAGDAQRESIILRNLCVTAPGYDTMVRYWAQALAAAQAGDDQRNVAHLTFIRGDRAYQAGYREVGERLARESVALMRGLDDPPHLILALNVLSSIYLDDGRVEEVRPLIAEMESAAAEMAIGFHTRLVELARARLDEADGNMEQVELTYSTLSATVPREGSFRMIRQILHLQAGYFYFRRGNSIQARQCWHRAWAVESRDFLANTRRWQAMVGMAESWFTVGKKEKGMDCLQRARAVAVAIGALPAWEQAAEGVRQG